MSSWEKTTLKETILNSGSPSSSVQQCESRVIYVNKDYMIMVSHNDINLTVPNNISELTGVCINLSVDITPRRRLIINNSQSQWRRRSLWASWVGSHCVYTQMFTYSMWINGAQHRYHSSPKLSMSMVHQKIIKRLLLFQKGICYTVLYGADQIANVS